MSTYVPQIPQIPEALENTTTNANAGANTIPILKEGELIKKRFCCEKLLGEGGFGAVYLVKDINTSETYAMKIESCANQMQLLKIECGVLHKLKAAGSRHACEIRRAGRTQTFNFVIMTLLGRSLGDLQRICPSHFSLSTSLRIGIQSLEAIEDLHGIGYLHRDLKPGNYAIGREEKDQHRTIFMLDFGMARRYVNDRNEIRRPRAAAGFRGTVRYAPLNCHRGQELSRKDEIESWFYQLVEVTRGRLPWNNLTEKTEVGKSKDASRESGQLFRGCPKQYKQILNYIDSLKYWDKPDYESIYSMLKHCLNTGGYRESDPFDWEKGGIYYNATRGDKESDPHI